MAFTATYTIQLNHNPLSAPVIASILNAYFKIGDYEGGAVSGVYTATCIVFANAETRNNDLGDFIGGSQFNISTPYVANVDPYQALYAKAKSSYPDAVDI